MNIDVTMYDVGLGAALLLDFKDESTRLHVLADGGDAPAAPSVEEKIWQRLKPLGSDRPRIDLVIGTHYDADHLDGITYILEQGRIAISQLWLPPVGDDVSGTEFGRLAGDDDLLVNRFRGDGGEEAFVEYVSAKERRQEALRTVDDALERLTQGGEESAHRPEDRSGLPDRPPRSTDYSVDEWRRIFALELDHAYNIVGRRGCEHVPDADVIREPDESDFDLAYLARAAERGAYPLRREIDDWLRHRSGLHGGSARAARAELAHMRIANAKDGINASALKKLVDALPDPCGILVECHRCSDHAPRTFAWDGRLFVPGGSGAVTATILSPTDRLIADRRDRIPTGVVAFRAKRWDRLEGLSHSNQLSYVVRFDAGEQGILVTGDSGFDGFAIADDSVRKYEKGLTDRLQGLAVIQVPHHGGISRHFYRAMHAAGFEGETQSTYFLLSHEANSPHRPSMALADYMSKLPRKRPLQLLFTNEAKKERVRGYGKRFAGQADLGGGKDGDVRLLFDGGEWTVKRHKVRPPS